MHLQGQSSIEDCLLLLLSKVLLQMVLMNTNITYCLLKETKECNKQPNECKKTHFAFLC